MGKIVIKKRIALEFLGEDYKDCYLEFKTIPMRDYEGYIEKSASNKDEKKAVQFIIDTLQDLFVGGKFIEDGELFDVTAEQVNDFDVNTILTVFKVLTGQDQSPN